MGYIEFILEILLNFSKIKSIFKKAFAFIKLQIRLLTGKQKKIRNLVKKYQLPKAMENEDMNSVKIIKKHEVIEEYIDGNSKR